MTGASVDTGAGQALRQSESVWVAVTYFCVWMTRLMGWMPELGHCVVCGLDLRGGEIWWSPNADGVTCGDDRRSASRGLSAAGVREVVRMGKTPLTGLLEEAWSKERGRELLLFTVSVLERHLERRLRSAAALY